MATVEQLLMAERAMRDLLAREGLDPPDAVEWWSESIALRWEAQKVVIVVECPPARDPPLPRDPPLH
jgi:hypothetical protein